MRTEEKAAQAEEGDGRKQKTRKVVECDSKPAEENVKAGAVKEGERESNTQR